MQYVISHIVNVPTSRCFTTGQIVNENRVPIIVPGCYYCVHVKSSAFHIHIYISTHSIRPCYATRSRQLHYTIFTYAVTVTRKTQLIYIYIPPNEASPSESRIPLATPPSKIIVRLLYRVFCKSSRGVMIRLTAEGRIKPRRGSREDAYEPALSLSLSLSLSRLPNS